MSYYVFFLLKFVDIFYAIGGFDAKWSLKTIASSTIVFSSDLIIMFIEGANFTHDGLIFSDKLVKEAGVFVVADTLEFFSKNEKLSITGARFDTNKGYIDIN